MLEHLKLDRSLYFSTVYGEFVDEVRYRQDKLPFDANGDLVVSKLDDAQRAHAEEKASKIKVEKIEGQEAIVIGGDVNLDLWLRGKAKYQAGQIYAAVKKRHARSFNNFNDVVSFLVFEPTGPKVVAPPELSPFLKPKD